MFSNSTRVFIQFGDCDPAGIVYYPNYFRMFDNATAALLSAAFGMNKRQWVAHYGIAGIPMVDTSSRFLIPSQYGDEIEIRTSISELGRSSFGVLHHVYRDDALAIEAREKRVWVQRDETGAIRSAALPDDVRERLSS
ncbi:thioesterase family protein [Devosia sp. MC521]|uniref:acyl-CoA thioesterase n=1 Tax=Devosia sp. MC521 TaxID=2759954 RepID=UPI0015FAD8AE|nr:thioesterase family protein [Devosia sp. MC521]MBJ6986404.1 acyl-CoA thioesterase [Devosia sp. MC521]QMW64124.1 acyl-CoA thioesterase [Devosia sp. MC521]